MHRVMQQRSFIGDQPLRPHIGIQLDVQLPRRQLRQSAMRGDVADEMDGTLVSIVRHRVARQTQWVIRRRIARHRPPQRHAHAAEEVQFASIGIVTEANGTAFSLRKMKRYRLVGRR